MIRSPFAYSDEFLASQAVAVTPARLVGSGPSPAYCFVDPDAATLMLAPGPTSSSSTPNIVVIQGYSDDFAVQCWNRGSQTAPGFSADDQLTAAIYRVGVASAICAPTVDWYNSGWARGQVVVSISPSQAATLQPPVQYRLVITWVPAADDTREAVIVRLPIAVERIY